MHAFTAQGINRYNISQQRRQEGCRANSKKVQKKAHVEVLLRMTFHPGIFPNCFKGLGEANIEAKGKQLGSATYNTFSFLGLPDECDRRPSSLLTLFFATFSILLC